MNLVRAALQIINKILMEVNNAISLITEKLNNWAREIIAMTPNLILAGLILAVAFVVAKLIRKITLKLISKVSQKQVINNLFAIFVYIFIVGIGLFAALSVLQLDKAVTSILAGAGIVGLALGFAFQDIAANFISGIFISFRRPFNVGDLIEARDYQGLVTNVNLRDTIITTLEGQDVIIPNKEIFQNPIINYNSSGRRRMDLSIGVSYGDDLEKVKRIVLEAVDKISLRNTADEVTLFYKEFGDSSINFDVRIWVKTTAQIDYLTVRSEAIMFIKKAFDENDITIPFPIRTLDFGIKGGEKLSEMDVKVFNSPSQN